MEIIYAFIVWTFCMYWMHRLAHSGMVKFLKKIHVTHHAMKYGGRDAKFDYLGLLFWFGSWRASLDVLISMTLPLIIITLFIGGNSFYLLVFHYFYEALLSEHVLEHNPKIKGSVTKIFAWGAYHLTHHQD